MTSRLHVVRARRWLLICFLVGACGMVMTALAALPWLAWATIGVSAAVTTAAYLVLGEETAVVRTEPSLLVDTSLSEPSSGPLSAPGSAPPVAPQAEIGGAVSDLNALIDSLETLITRQMAMHKIVCRTDNNNE